MNLDARFDVNFRHRVVFVDDAWELSNPAVAQALAGAGQPGRVMVFVDGAVVRAWPQLPDRVRAYAEHHHRAMTLAAPIAQLPGGEIAKSDRGVFDDVCQAIHDAHIDRQSYVLVIGGGAALDIVGFAAAVTHRGLRLLRMPTTTLAQADSGVGVKCGINAFGKKNFLGAFAVPAGVINDQTLLTSLSDADWRSGFSEVVKVALVKDAQLFETVEQQAQAIVDRDHAQAGPIIARSAQLHFNHIVTGGDPFELTTARPLDFGHWSAHKLEQITGFTLRHGDAVAIGVALDAMYSHLVGLAPPELPQRAIAILRRLELPIWHDALGRPDEVLAGLEEFREHLGGNLTITLLRDAGQPMDVHLIDTGLMRRAMARLRDEA